MDYEHAKQVIKNRLEEYLLTVTSKAGEKYICLYAEVEQKKIKRLPERLRKINCIIIVSVAAITEIFLTL